MAHCFTSSANGLSLRTPEIGKLRSVRGVMDILHKIANERRLDVERLKVSLPLDSFKEELALRLLENRHDLSSNHGQAGQTYW